MFYDQCYFSVFINVFSFFCLSLTISFTVLSSNGGRFSIHTFLGTDPWFTLRRLNLVEIYISRTVYKNVSTSQLSSRSTLFSIKISVRRPKNLESQ